MVRVLLVVVGMVGAASAGCAYYVDNVGGNDANSGTSATAAWKHLYHVRSQTFGASAVICLLRGDTWYGGKLEFQGTRAVAAVGAVTADGTSTAPFSLDAYGVGAPPTLNAEYAIPSGASWTCSANICSINTNTFPEGAPTRIDMVKFGGIWGTCEGANVLTYCPTTGGTAALTANYQFNYSNPTLAVYDSIGTNPVTDYGGVTPVLDGETHLIDIDGVNYVSVQHLDLLNQSWYGLEYRGNAGTDHLTVANVYSDTEVPFNYHGTGFYIHPNAASADLNFYNVEAHRGFYGFSFECAALPCTTANSLTNATLVNVKGYFNRSFGLNDITYTGTSAHYSYAHFYGNQIKWPLVGDVNGGVAGVGNVSNMLDPHVAAWKLYTPRVSLTYGTIGAQFGADTLLNGQLSSLGGAPLSIAVATNYPLTATLISEIQGWVNSGYDISSAGLSNVSYQNPYTLNLQCAGATTASLTIASNTLTTAITGSGCTAVNYSLTNASYTTVQQVEFALRGAGYSALLPQPCGACSWIAAAAMLSKDLAPVSTINIQATAASLVFSIASFLPDELNGSKTWISTNLTGTTGKYVYIYPATLFCAGATCGPFGGQSVTLPQAYTQAAGYDGAVGSIAMQAAGDQIVGGYDGVASMGVDAHGLVGCSMAGWAALSPTVLAQTIQILAEKSSVWGVPYACFWGPGTLTNGQLSRIVADLTASGVTLMTNSALVAFLEGKQAIPAGGTYYAWGPDGSGAAKLFSGAPTYLSPVVGAGSTLAATYQLDAWGRQQAQFRSGWDMGALVLVPTYLGMIPGH